MRRNGTYFIVFAIAIGLALAAAMLFRSGVFSPDPTVLIKAKNTYTDTLRVITDEDYRPYSFYDEKGRFSGHDVELIALVANKLEMNLDLRFLPWNEGIAATLVKTLNLGKNCTYYPDNRLAMQALIDGEVDCTIIRNAVGTVLLRELNAKGIKGFITLGQSYMCFGINSDYPELATKINTALEELKADGELAKPINIEELMNTLRKYLK